MCIRDRGDSEEGKEWEEDDLRRCLEDLWEKSLYIPSGSICYGVAAAWYSTGMRKVSTGHCVGGLGSAARRNQLQMAAFLVQTVL
eukprot:1266431-Rhodomonas_salina.2